MGKATIPAHSPKIAHACAQSSGVLAMVPASGVSNRPPCTAATGSSGTAVVARNLARLAISSSTHSSGDLWGFAIFLDLWARVSCSSGRISTSLDGSMLASSDWVGLCPVIMMSPALSSAFASVANKTAGGLFVELAIV